MINLSSSLVEVTDDREVFKMLHRNCYEITTVSDFLSLPEEVVINNFDILFNLLKLLEDNLFKMDYALTDGELAIRNKIRSELQGEIKKRRMGVSLDEVLNTDICKVTERKLSSKIKKILSFNGIFKVEDILILDFYTLCGSENGCLKLPFWFLKDLSRFLSKNGLEFMMVNPFTFEVKDYQDFEGKLVEEEEDMEIISDDFGKEEWFKVYEILRLFHHYHHHILIPKGYVCEGVCLYDWLDKQRKDYFAVKLGKDEIKALEKLGMIWKGPKDSQGLKSRKLILKDNEIKSIKFISGNVVTCYLDEPDVSTADSDYVTDLARVIDGEKLYVDSSDDNLDDLENDDSYDVDSYIEMFNKMHDEEVTLEEEIARLREELEVAKKEIYDEYECKYNKMYELYRVCVQIDIILGRGGDDSKILDRFPDVKEVRNLSVSEIYQKISLLDVAINEMNDFIMNSLGQLKEKQKEEEVRLQNLRCLKQSLEDELGTLQKKVKTRKR